MKNSTFGQWSLFRIIRLVFGIAIIIQGIVSREILLIVAGILLSGMALLNIGCCGPTGCIIPPNKIRKIKREEIAYEEVVK